MNLTIKDIANLILSLDPARYCIKEIGIGDNMYYQVADYIISSSKPNNIGELLKITIKKDKIYIYYFPTFNDIIPIQNEDEFRELVGICLDFKKKVENFIEKNIKSLIRKVPNYQNPFMAYEAFAEAVDAHFNNRQDAVRRPQPRRAMENGGILGQMREEMPLQVPEIDPADLIDPIP